ncbi:MAG: hypothetical protein JXR49_19270 [Acidobacteria bacterium]|nr:hypothetical protein [Acidobacteriota bacterium]
MPSERDYAERLREQAYKTLSPQINDLEKELKEFSSALSTGIYQIERKLEAINQVELPTTKVVLDEILQDVLRQKDQEEKSLVHFTRDLRIRETQEEILGLLLDYANSFFPHVALFTVRNDRFIGWSSRGYSEEAARKIADCSFPCSECPQFQEALDSEDIKSASDLSGNSSLSFLQAESEGTPHLIPLHVMQRPVAILFAEGADDASCRPNALSVLTNLTELRLENIALKILYALTEGTSAAATESPAAIDQAEEPEPETPFEVDRVEEEAVPEIPIEADQVEEETEPESPAEVEKVEEAGAEPPAAIDQVEETEPESPAEAEQVEEAETEPPAAIDQVEEAEPESPAAEQLEESEPEPPEQEAPETATESQEEPGEAEPQETPADADEEKLHSDAKRFARLLVSEIKLYNENSVLEGRKNRDLYIRLKRDIDKSREMYENRVSSIVSKKIDYFHDEVIRILGENDPSTLGSDYPGSQGES